ncbi:amino acid adenylation domain-containing protein [Kitasatospora sp. GP30]|uniref:non-ribosomal peptide synthetase n=1 Tax=Kitasatospora sp. GP30 TaxID=3035084 RepID=UPI000C7071DF|nr:non-ribosomal peptide synthetase [Kitasatospora sp. GP30]MDH6140344.1 amino acid adenylation domain-containing protein [Kitasatospora sp. GP30]
MNQRLLTSDPAAALREAAALLGCATEDLHGQSLHALGGSSLDGARLAFLLRTTLRLDVSAVQLVTAPDLGLALREAGSAPLAPAAADASAEPHPTDDEVPLSWQQRLVWYQTMLEPASTRYHFHALFRFERAPDPAALSQALYGLLEHHRGLGVRLVVVDGEPRQRPATPQESRRAAEIHELHLDHLPHSSEALLAAVGADRSFELDGGPLVRWSLVHLPQGRAVMVHSEHHLVHDGESFNLLLRSLADGGPTAVDGRYLDYARRQARAVAQRRGPAVADEVLEELREDFPELFPKLPAPTAEADHHLRLPLPRQLARAAESTARAQGVSYFTVLFAAFGQALAAVRRPDAAGPLLVGTAVGNRPAELHDTVGMFVSTAPVVVRAAAGSAPAEVLAATARALARASARADVPLPDLVAALGSGVRGGTDRGLVQAAFSMHEQLQSRIRLGGREAEVEVGAYNGAAKFPVNAIALVDRSAAEQHTTLLFEATRSHVDADELWLLWHEFVRALVALTGFEDDADLSGAADRAPDVVALVLRAARADGALTALRDDTDEIGYAELPALGEALARRLGSGPAVVGLIGTPSARFFAAEYAVLHAGATFVPLDRRRYPAGLDAMVERVGCRLVVDLDGDGPDRLGGAPVLRWAELRGAVEPWDSGTPDPQAAVDLPAYTMFTSGSTGAPKAVVIGRDALSRLAAWGRETLELAPGTVVSQGASIGFDASLWDVWPALTAGARIQLIPDPLRADPYELAQWLVEQRVEVAFAPAPVAQLLVECPWPSGTALRVLGSGGDRLHPVTAQDLPFRVLNLYGPTECTIVSVADWVTPGAGEPPIGRPLPYFDTRIVDHRGTPVPESEPGELWLGGPALALGYHGDPRQTRCRFVPDPHRDRVHLVYRTGDLVRRRPDGALDYLGRLDRQLKVSGVRVELGELEATALAQPGVRQAAAVVVEGADRTRLELVLVPAVGTDWTEVIGQVRDALPGYLRHLTLRCVARLPLTPNGKVDVTMLSTPVPAAGSAAGTALTARAKELLRSSTLDAAWFELGGSSLEAARLVNIAVREHGLEVTLTELLECGDVGLLIKAWAGEDSSPAPVAPAEQLAPAAAPPTSAGRPTGAGDVLWPALAQLPAADRLALAQRLIASTLD